MPLKSNLPTSLRIGDRDAGFNWNDLAWLKSATTLPVVLKGVVTFADAQLAVTHGAYAVWAGRVYTPHARARARVLALALALALAPSLALD